eukprot:289773-Pelagomonas_calceolata.AAC.2
MKEGQATCRRPHFCSCNHVPLTTAGQSRLTSSLRTTDAQESAHNLRQKALQSNAIKAFQSFNSGVRANIPGPCSTARSLLKPCLGSCFVSSSLITCQPASV